MLAFPKQVADDPRSARLAEIFGEQPVKLWEGGSIQVSSIAWTAALESALQLAKGTRRLVLGLETIEEQLGREEKGLKAREERGETVRGQRMSRLLLIAEGASERFYRQCERLTKAHAGRLVTCQIRLSGDEVGRRLFREGKSVKAMMIADKDALMKFLFMLAGTPRESNQISGDAARRPDEE